MKKGSEIIVKIEKTEFPSIGIGNEGERKIYVKNSFPGQVIRGRVNKKKADYAMVKPLEVLERAEYEIPAKCPHFGICGGCSSQTLTYDKQVEFLSEEVKELFIKSNIPTGVYENPTGSIEQWMVQKEPQRYNNEKEKITEFLMLDGSFVDS